MGAVALQEVGGAVAIGDRMPARTSASATWVPALSGARAVAALWVFLFHVWNAAGKPELPLPAGSPPVLGIVLGGGWFGVDIFFVLSGFILTWQAAFPLSTRVSWDQYGDFVKRRVLRVYPAYYANLSVLLLLGWTLWAAKVDLLDLGLHLFMVHNLDMHSVMSINGVYWTLPFEWQFYLLFPLLLVVAARIGIVSFVALIAAASLAYKLMVNSLAPTPTVSVGPLALDLLAQLPFRIEEFALGMAAAMVAKRGVLSVRATRVAGYAGIAGFACIVCYFVISGIPWWTPNATPWLRMLAIGTALGALFVSLAAGVGPASWLLSRRPMVWLGEISYSVYLWHFPIIMILVGSYPALIDPAVSTPPLLRLLAVAAPLVVVVSAASYYAIERPFLRSRREHSGRPGSARSRSWRVPALGGWAALLFAAGFAFTR